MTEISATADALAKPVVRRRLRLTRRKLLLGGLGAILGGGLYTRYVEPFWPAVERVPMDLPDLDPAFEGLRVVQISDVHVSAGASMSYLREQFRRCTAMRPDVIALTGDYLTYAEPGQIPMVEELVRELRAPLVLATLGNHDYYSRNSRVYAKWKTGEFVADKLIAALHRCGVRVLCNESFVLSRGDAKLQFVGLDDLWAGEYDPVAAFADADPALPCIALSHNPDTIDDLRRLPCHWVLSGHTHGGQVRLPLYGALILPVENRQYDEGLFQVDDKRLYVNRGLGYLRQVRFLCRPEITEFTLTRRAVQRPSLSEEGSLGFSTAAGRTLSMV